MTAVIRPSRTPREEQQIHQPRGALFSVTRDDGLGDVVEGRAFGRR
jgi:hypothetical protein